MRGSFSRFGAPANRKDPLTKGDLASAVARLRPDNNYDDSLFIAQLLISMRHSVVLAPDSISFHLPGHKADTTFEGDDILVLASHSRRALLLPSAVTNTCSFATTARAPDPTYGSGQTGLSPRAPGSWPGSDDSSRRRSPATPCALAELPPSRRQVSHPTASKPRGVGPQRHSKFTFASIPPSSPHSPPSATLAASPSRRSPLFSCFFSFSP
ncbi:hypothetical protein CONPUDRAFT_160760 [Coniophora puteana RWD-64-598 SS2]|uniref:Uncharacterized protein n=1 Tax=Coniophora puteana (strain RWD-64-598) TaxID=741705 RepID=R7SDC5_CONPW|nr:uncharacterized protein CONPUDRAFT_160760 [Coniophora puteana RWD-64-598 SS2]EIW73747.1 hypothetical protein CONPUDRAFT_160760 [Coniophora puteana RWD-64-598 SS2]